MRSTRSSPARSSLTVALWVFFLACAGTAGPARAADDRTGEPDPPLTAADIRAQIVGGVAAPAQGLRGLSPVQGMTGRPRSVPAALGLSAAIPGLGQAYNRQWVKAAVGVALEAAVWTGFLVWKAEGAELRDDYQDYAHAHWSPPRYASWLNDYSVYIQENFGAQVTAPPVSIPDGIDFTRPETWSSEIRAQVGAMFRSIQALERQMFHVETGAAFSHTLPDFSEQQYYELVGKYYQFAPGWEDYPDWIVGGDYVPAIDPNMSGPDGTKPNVSARFFDYADDHAHANTVLRRASRLSMFFIVTRFVAAIDAAISAKLHNDRLVPGIGMRPLEDGSVQPSATLTLRLGS